MSEEIKDMNLYQKLAKIRKGTEVIQKNKRGFNYTYTSIEEILSHVTAGMNKYNVSLIPSFSSDANVEHITYNKVKILKNGERFDEPVNEYIAKSTMIYTWVNNDNPSERIDVPWFISGSQSDPSQAVGSALTYSLRYFLSNYFQIATPEDDPDNWRSKQKEAESAEDKQIASKIIETVDVAVRKYLADNPDKGSDVKAFVTKFVKSGDYFKIDNPALASKLLNDFKSKFGVE